MAEPLVRPLKDQDSNVTQQGRAVPCCNQIFCYTGFQKHYKPVKNIFPQFMLVIGLWACVHHGTVPIVYCLGNHSMAVIAIAGVQTLLSLLVDAALVDLMMSWAEAFPQNLHHPKEILSKAFKLPLVGWQTPIAAWLAFLLMNVTGAGDETLDAGVAVAGKIDLSPRQLAMFDYSLKDSSLPGFFEGLDIGVMLTFILVISVLSQVICFCATMLRMRDELVRHGHEEYNPKMKDHIQTLCGLCSLGMVSRLAGEMPKFVGDDTFARTQFLRLFTKVVFQNVWQLSLSVSILGLVFDTASHWTLANMFLSIGTGGLTSALAAWTFYKNDPGFTERRWGLLFLLNTTVYILPVVICLAMCLIQLIGIGCCSSHVLNLTPTPHCVVMPN